MCPPHHDKLPSLNQDIWVNIILPFVGMGHFAFVAGVNRQMKQYYKAYCDTVKIPPMVKGAGKVWDIRPATTTDTFYSAVFYSVTCAEFWNSQKGYHYNACALIAKAGNLHVLRWARKKNFSMG
jgi:hypothetical protein